MPIEGLNFDEEMEKVAAEQNTESEGVGLTEVRYFTDVGIEQVAALLKKIRTDKELYKDDVEELVNDPEYTKKLSGSYKIDRAHAFETKKDLCEYFMGIFDSESLEANRKNAGLWTWLALAYYSQFVKNKSSVKQMGADACWIYNPVVYRFGRRHYVAGSMYLYRDVVKTGQIGLNAIEMLFLTPPTEFGRFIDALTNVEESIRTPAFFCAAIMLYYDAESRKHFKKMSIKQDGAGSVRQLIRVLQQFMETHDFFAQEDASILLDCLPSQFDQFKKKES